MHDDGDHTFELVTFRGGPFDGTMSSVEMCPEHQAMPELALVDRAGGPAPHYTWNVTDQVYDYIGMVDEADIDEWPTPAGEPHDGPVPS